MKEYIKSTSTGKVYCPRDCIRLVNMKQLAFYMKHGVEVLDFYSSKDFKTGEDIIVFLVNKFDTKDIYQKWLDNKNV